VQISMGVIPAQRYDPLVTDAPSNITWNPATASCRQSATRRTAKCRNPLCRHHNVDSTC
jgi:hypothetical protein